MDVGLPCVPLSDRYNTLYGTSEFHGAMMKGVVRNRNVASVIAATRNAKTLAGGIGSFWPIPEWHRQYASKIVPDRLQECSKAMLAGHVRTMRELGMVSKRPIIAIDKRLIPRHDKKWGPDLVRSKYKSGTGVFETYITVQCANSKCRLVLASMPMGAFSFTPKFVRKIVQLCEDVGAKPRLILLDREFYSTDVMRELDGLGVQYLIPCTNRDAAVGALRDYASGRRKAISRMTMSNSDRKEVSYYAAVTDRKRRKSSKSDAPENRFIVFATNARWVDVVKYGKRWGMETGYKMIEHMRAKTSSQGSIVRAFYFWYSLLVFNLWVIANAILGRGAGWDGKPIMSQNTLGEIILSEISESRPKRKPPP